MLPFDNVIDTLLHAICSLLHLLPSMYMCSDATLFDCQRRYSFVIPIYNVYVMTFQSCLAMYDLQYCETNDNYSYINCKYIL